ncbi:hypothetical protein [Halovulum sp. GXIMD14793]
MKMLLEVEKKKPTQVKNFDSVEKALRDLKSYGPHSFAILTAQDGSYLQIAGGRVTCVLEHRNRNDGKHHRAYLAQAKVPFEGKQTLMFGGGHMTMQPDEVLFIDDVVEVFRAFFEGNALPDRIQWRDMTDIVS